MVKMVKGELVEPNRVMEAWLSMMTEAVRGNSDAREAVRSMTMAPMRPDEMLRLMTTFMPPGVAPVQVEMFNDWLEEYWKAMGVVPRYRYLELLERYERARERVEELERHNRTRTQLSSSLERTSNENADRVLSMWGKVMEESMKMQQEMLKTWMTVSEDRPRAASPLPGDVPPPPAAPEGEGTPPPAPSPSDDERGGTA